MRLEHRISFITTGINMNILNLNIINILSTVASLYDVAQFTSGYSLLRGTAIMTVLHQLGKPGIHDVYASTKIVYGHLSRETQTRRSGSSYT
jgi:hypothetical protein